MICRVACVAVAAALAVASASAQDTRVERGKAVYAEQKCKLCHSIVGQGNAKGPLDGVGSKYSEDDLRAWIVNPKKMTEKTKSTRQPVMKAYPNMAPPDVDALVAYMQTLKK
jgi:cytochrome c2